MAKQKLEVGKTYENRFGKRVKIVVSITPTRFRGDDGEEYTDAGLVVNKSANWDLIKEVKEK